MIFTQLLRVAGALGLLLTILPSILYFADVIDHSATKVAMTVGMGAWFGTVLAKELLDRRSAAAAAVPDADA